MCKTIFRNNGRRILTLQLSEKELLMVSESLMGHLSTVEKFRSYSQACTDQEMKQLLDNHARQMERHSQELLNMIQTSAMTGTSGYSPYSQAHQYGGSQYGTQPSISQSQYGTQQGIGSQSQYGMGTQSQYGTQHGYGSPSQYGAVSQTRYGTQQYGSGTQQGMGATHGSNFGVGSQSIGSEHGVVTTQFGSQPGIGSQSQYGQKY